MAHVKITPEMADIALANINWTRLDAMTDADIARQVAENPDAALILTDEQAAVAVVRGVRKRLGLSQVAFAARYRIPIGTLRDWEQNRKRPDATALAYLHVIACAPETLAQALNPAIAA